ncbi:hypothetical protein AB0K20_11610 [Micromonospora matsumotoense]|uniref:hypothetical protein n=1 Tax=Micromonospora matsumotoense TaxID=121616 RepID=UPI00343C0D72
MHPYPARIALSIGHQTRRTSRFVTLLLLDALVIFAVGCGTGILIFVTLTTEPGNPYTLLGIVPLLLAVVQVVFMALFAVAVIRAAAWLEGSRLTVVNVATRTVDLRAARSVSLRATGSVKRTPLLTVTTDARTVKLILRSAEGVLLPPGELVALAAALDTARCPGAAETAGWLRAVAADPRTML